MTQLATTVLIYVISLAVVFVAIVRIVTTDAELWTHGRLSKTAWIVACLWLIIGNRSGALPVGAIAAIWHTWKLNRSRPGDSLDVPFAEGTPETPNTEERA